MTHDPGGKSKPHWDIFSKVTAGFGGPDDCYRYWLEEIWEPRKPLVMFQLMNPSVAGLEFSDPTLQKTGAFARRWGYGGQLIGNDHAYRATDNTRLAEATDPVGTQNDHHLIRMAYKAEIIVLAQGSPKLGQFWPRSDRVIELFKSHGQGSKLRYLKRSETTGRAWHPLYLAYAERLKVWE